MYHWETRDSSPKPKQSVHQDDVPLSSATSWGDPGNEGKSHSPRVGMALHGMPLTERKVGHSWGSSSHMCWAENPSLALNYNNRTMQIRTCYKRNRTNHIPRNVIVHCQIISRHVWEWVCRDDCQKGKDQAWVSSTIPGTEIQFWGKREKGESQADCLNSSVSFLINPDVPKLFPAMAGAAWETPPPWRPHCGLYPLNHEPR